MTPSASTQTDQDRHHQQDRQEQDDGHGQAGQQQPHQLQPQHHPEQEQQQHGEQGRTELMLQPPVDIFETPDRIVLLADLPGVTRDGLDITIHRGRLTIQGKLQIPRPDGRIPGRYQRVFQLTEVVDEQRFSAELKDGVLRLEMPKRKEYQPQRVNVAVRDSANRPQRPERGGQAEAGQTGSGASDGPGKGGT